MTHCRVAWLISATGLAAVLTACAGADNDSDYSLVGDDPRIIIHQAAPISEREGWFLADAGFSGNLAWDRNTGCLYLEAGESSYPEWLVIWPRGSRLVTVDGVPGVEVRGEQARSDGESEATHVVRVGKRVDAGGTFLDEEYFARLRSNEVLPEVASVLGWVEDAREASGCGNEHPVLLIDHVLSVRNTDSSGG